MSQQTTMTRVEALRTVGFWQTSDSVFVFISLVIIVSAVVVGITNGVTLIGALAWGVALAIVLLTWTVLLIFRSMWFVLQILAEIKMMPAAASKLVLAFMRGQGGS